MCFSATYDFGISPPSCRRETALVSIVVVSIPVRADASLFTLHFTAKLCLRS